MKRIFLGIFLFAQICAFGQIRAQSAGAAVKPSVPPVVTDELLAAVSSYCTEYQAVYDAYTTKPDDATATIWNTFVTSIVGTGEWAKIDVIYVYAAHTNGAGEALINWINPGTYDATAYNAPAFVANQGFTGGATKYIDCNVAPNGLTNYILNSATIANYCRTNTAAGTFTECGVKGSAGRHLNMENRFAADNSYLRINTAAGGIEGAANADARGMFIASRTDANTQILYRNKALLINGVAASDAIPNLNIYVLGKNDAGSLLNPTNRQLSMFFAGSGFNQTNVNNFTDAFETAMDALGTGVIAYNPLEDLMLLQYLAFQQRIHDYEKNLIPITP